MLSNDQKNWFFDLKYQNQTGLNLFLYIKWRKIWFMETKTFENKYWIGQVTICYWSLNSKQEQIWPTKASFLDWSLHILFTELEILLNYLKSIPCWPLDSIERLRTTRFGATSLSLQQTDKLKLSLWVFFFKEISNLAAQWHCDFSRDQKREMVAFLVRNSRNDWNLRVSAWFWKSS